MRAWAEDSFGNDIAADWAGDFVDGGKGLEAVAEALNAVIEIGDDYLDSDLAVEAIAACEVIARLRGNWGKRSAYSEGLDAWIDATPVRSASNSRRTATRVPAPSKSPTSTRATTISFSPGTTRARVSFRDQSSPEASPVLTASSPESGDDFDSSVFSALCARRDLCRREAEFTRQTNCETKATSRLQCGPSPD